MKNKQYLKEVRQLQKIAGILKEGDGQAGEAATPEKAADVAANLTNKIKSNPTVMKFADAVAKDPAASKQLMDLLAKHNVSLNEDIDSSAVHNLALAFADKAESLEEGWDGNDIKGSLFAGLIGGGALADKFLTYQLPHELGDMFDKTVSVIPGLDQSGTVILGALAGAVLAVVGQYVYEKIKGGKS